MHRWIRRDIESAHSAAIGSAGPKSLVIVCAFAALGSFSPVAAQAPPGAAAPVSTAVEDEVLENLRMQVAGPFEVRDFNLPESYLRQVADRAIRSSFRERYRVVTAEGAAEAGRVAPSAGTEQHPPGLIPVVQPVAAQGSPIGRMIGLSVAGFVALVAVIYGILLVRGRRRT